MLVSTVPGTMAGIQPWVSKAGAEISSGVAFTSGAAASFQPPSRVQSPSPAGVSVLVAGRGWAGHGLTEGSLPLRHGGRVLRRDVADVLNGLDGPGLGPILEQDQLEVGTGTETSPQPQPG